MLQKGGSKARKTHIKTMKKDVVNIGIERYFKV